MVAKSKGSALLIISKPITGHNPEPVPSSPTASPEDSS